MKQKDIALMVAITGVSTIIAFALANFVIAPPENRQAKIQVVETISDTFPEHDKRYFNENAINPTKTVQIGDTTNPEPFR